MYCVCMSNDPAMSESCSIFHGEHDGRPMIVRLNVGARAVAGSADWGIRVGVAIPLRRPRPDGLPDAEESEQLAAIEDALTAASIQHALLVAVISTDGMREFLFYLRKMVRGFSMVDLPASEGRALAD
jgi:hypothetical protein